MEGTIRYIGLIPVYSFKMDWSPGQSVDLATFQSHVQASVKRGLNSSEDFLAWLNQAVEGKEFLVDLSTHESYVDETGEETPVGTTSETETPKRKRGRPRKNTVMVEASSVKVAASLADAKQRLRKVRHPDEVGTTEPSEPARVNRTAAEHARDIEATPSHVITGDDLEAARNGVIETDHSKRQATVLMLDSNSQVVKRVPTSKEEQEKVNAASANLSGKVRVLQTEADNPDSYIISGGDKEEVLSSKGDNQVRPGKVNKYLQTQGNFSAIERTVTIEDLMNQPDEREVGRLIELCKDPVTLKMIRIYFDGNGLHRLIEKVDHRLRKIVKF